MNLQFFKENKLNILLTILYALFTLLVVMHHEIWADEAQVWQLCKYLSLPELFKHLVNEGHPSFFYLLVMPFAKMGFSIFSMQLICWAAMCASVFLFLAFSPFNKFAKFAIVTSCGFLYFLPVIARSYSILPLIVFALAILYPKQKQHPFIYSILIFLMANTHAIMVGFAGLLGCLFVYENLIKDWVNLQIKEKKIFISSALVIFFGIFLVWLQLHGTTDSNICIQLKFNHIFLVTTQVILRFFISAINADYSELFGMINITNFEFFLLAISVVLYLILFGFLFKLDKKIFLITFFSILFQFIIYVIAYNIIYPTRIFSAHIILIFALWVALYEEEKANLLNRKINIILFLFFIMMFLTGFKYCVFDMLGNYSGAKVTAQFIEKNIDKDSSIIITENAPHSMAIIQELDNKYEILTIFEAQPVKYIIWDETMLTFIDGNEWNTYMKRFENFKSEFKNKKKYIIVPIFHEQILNLKMPSNFKIIYKSNPTILRYENYKIFEYQEK